MVVANAELAQSYIAQLIFDQRVFFMGANLHEIFTFAKSKSRQPENLGPTRSWQFEILKKNPLRIF